MRMYIYKYVRDVRNASLLLLLLLLLICNTSKLDFNRQPFQDPTAVGLKGTIPTSWAALTNLETL